MLILAALMLLAPPARQGADAPPPRVEYADVHGIRVQYLDWGGRGEPIVLVPARCETPFVFGDLAPLLTPRFRVLGVTARGCGASVGAATGGYGLDVQIQDLIGLLDALRIERATFAGHSASGGKVVRLARLFPQRVTRIVTFDTIYAGATDRFETEFQAALGSQTGSLSLESHRRDFEAWELGTWSPALERDFLERTEHLADGRLRWRLQPAEWQRAFVEDLDAGRYHETTVGCPALFLVAHDLDPQRIKQFSAARQQALRPMAEAIAQARREQLATYRKNGPHVRIVSLEGASHYLFIDHARKVAAQLVAFAEETQR